MILLLATEKRYECLEAVSTLLFASSACGKYGGVRQMKELVEMIVRALVDSPDQVDVKEIEATNMKILEIKVSKQDVGALIGKKGKTSLPLEE